MSQFEDELDVELDAGEQNNSELGFSDTSRHTMRTSNIHSNTNKIDVTMTDTNNCTNNCTNDTIISQTQTQQQTKQQTNKLGITSNLPPQLRQLQSPDGAVGCGSLISTHADVTAQTTESIHRVENRGRGHGEKVTDTNSSKSSKGKRKDPQTDIMNADGGGGCSGDGSLGGNDDGGGNDGGVTKSQVRR